MKQVILLCAFVFAMHFSADAQNHVYRGSFGHLEQKAFIEFIHDETSYSLKLCFDFDDVFFPILLSMGQYQKTNNDLVILTDQFNHYKMLLREIETKGCYFEKSFCSFDSLYLEYKKDIVDTPSFNFPEMNINPDKVRLDKERYRAQDSLCGFVPGLYEENYPSYLALEIFDDYTYCYYVNTIVVSKGIWGRKGNVLSFYDNCLGEVFSAMIGEGYIIGCFFIGDNPCARFRFISMEEQEYWNKDSFPENNY